ncbi:hypothetical protein [Bradyrhizobium sp. AZCC 2289]|uniref:PD-(D/E)XK nuclease domain-containing protein n=1 Tax=Bradyrhizobium sp. AZCC 2289 TaxID=3117026 RepID=UPI002FF12A20
MDDLEWAQFALDYLRRGRRSIHDDFNDLMNELREMAVARGEPWYPLVKSIIPTLYHYSLEFTADVRIPGENFSSPRNVAEKLAEFRAFAASMITDLDDAADSYTKTNNVDGPPFLVSQARARAQYFVDAIDFVSGNAPGDITQAVQENTFSIIERIALRFHESVLALRKHPHNGATFDVKNEWDCQYLFRSILAAYFTDIRCEEWNPSVGGSSTRCEFFLKSFRTMIELKYVRKAEDQKKIKQELADDLVNYGANPEVDRVFFLIYDPDSVLPSAVQLQKDFAGPTKGLKQVQVIVSPFRDKREATEEVQA